MTSITPKKIRSLVFTVLGIIGIVCFLQYIFFGIYGIIAGHSVQNDMTSRIFPAFLLAGLIKKHQIVSICLIVSGVFLLELSHYAEYSIPDKCIEQGKISYNQGEYETALDNYKRASEKYTWYLRFFNTSQHYQAKALWGICRTYIKTGEIDKAKEVYNFARQQYPEQPYIVTFERFKEIVDDPKYDYF
jgi:tetratricopeptide (TPR) repeat protein